MEECPSCKRELFSNYFKECWVCRKRFCYLTCCWCNSFGNVRCLACHESKLIEEKKNKIEEIERELKELREQINGLNQKTSG
jgi:hypothetical protein